MTPFGETPQGQGLQRQIRTAFEARSLWKCAGLQRAYRKAEAYYIQHNGVPPGQQHDDLQTTEKEIAMSIEQLIAANTAAIEALTTAIAGAKVGTTSAGSTDAKEEKAATGTKTVAAKTTGTKAAAKPKYTREQMVAVLTEVSEAHGKEAARALFSDFAKKMAEIPDEKIESVYLAAKAKSEEEPEGGEEDEGI